MSNQTNSYSAYRSQRNGGGGRVASDRLREAYAIGCEFAGLEEGTDRYSLLLLVKKVGNLIGVSPAMVRLLDYYMAFTRDVDWEEGGRPIVYQSLARTAMDLGVTERQIQKLEKALFEAGVIGWNDCGNHKRFGQRCPETGRLLYAFGVDLTPLAYLRATLEEKLHEKRLRDEAWREAKRRISWLRRQVRGLLAEWFQREEGDEEAIASFTARYEEIAIEVRAHLSLEAVRALLTRHEALHSELMAAMGVGVVEVPKTSRQPSPTKVTQQSSCTREQEFVHYQSTTQSSTYSVSSRDDACFQESVTEPPVITDPAASAGLAHVSLGMARNAAGPRLRDYLHEEATWSDLVEAAYRLRCDYGVSQASWGEACAVLGRNGAALCLLLTDHGATRPENRIRAPAAYFRGLIKRAEAGELRLHKSVFGLLERGTGCH